ncbi:MAG TPA: hypothetical protein VL093_14660 [Flavipsychrobacter sp.]|nr:hypothetical protein [Flavipsychrobacter sp.]
MALAMAMAKELWLWLWQKSYGDGYGKRAMAMALAKELWLWRWHWLFSCIYSGTGFGDLICCQLQTVNCQLSFLLSAFCHTAAARAPTGI